MNVDVMLKEGSLKGKVALVTGGATGLGKSMAKYFLELGADVVIASRKQEVLDATSKELMDLHGGTVLGISCDVRNYDEVEKTLSTINEKFGKLDILVHSHQIMHTLVMGSIGLMWLGTYEDFRQHSSHHPS